MNTIVGGRSARSAQRVFLISFVSLLTVCVFAFAWFYYSGRLSAFESVEIHLTETSPQGDAGGYAVPASGSSVHTCDLAISPSPVTQGSTLTLSWSGYQASGYKMRVYRGIASSTYLGQYRSPFTYSTTGLPPGQYIFTVERTDLVGGITEIVRCSKAVAINGPATAPDLTPDAPVVQGSGSTRTFSSVVRNIGSTSATGFSNRFRIDLGRDGTVDTEIAASPVSGLPAGDSIGVLSTSWTAVLGNHRVLAVADSGSNVQESNEGNNYSAWTDFSVVATSSLPDLVSANLAVAGGVSSVPVNTALALTARAHNASANTVSGAFTDRFQYSTNGGATWGDVTPAPAAIVNLGANASTSESGAFTPLTPGTYTIRHCVDQPANTIMELDEGNNCTTVGAYLTVTVTGGGSNPTASCSVAPISISTGGSATWTAVPAGGTPAYSYQWTGTEGLTGSATTTSKTYNTAGTKSGWVNVIDSLGLQSGLTACSNTVVVGSGGTLPDLAAANIRLAGGAIGLKSSTAQNAIFVDAQNIGTVDVTPPFTISLRWVTIASLGGAVTGVWTSGGSTNISLNAGQTYTYEGAGPSSLALGAFARIEFCVDTPGAGVISESIESNNCTTRDYQVTINGGSLPNLMSLGQVSMTPNIATLTAGTAYTFTQGVRNTKGANLNSFFWDSFTPGWEQFGGNIIWDGPFSTVSHPGISGNQTLTDTSATAYTFVTPGTSYMKFCADSANLITEELEVDNCSIRQYNVIPGAGTPTVSCSASAGSVVAGSPVTWTMTPAGGSGSYVMYQWRGTDGLNVTGAVTPTTTYTYSSVGSKSAQAQVFDGTHWSAWTNCSSNVNVTAAVSNPDLVPTAPVVSGSGATRTFASTILNSGGGNTASNFFNIFEWGTKPVTAGGCNDLVTGVNTWNANPGVNPVPAPLNAGVSVNISDATWNASVPNTYCVRTMVDTGNAIDEGVGEADNTSNWTTFVVAAPPSVAPQASLEGRKKGSSDAWTSSVSLAQSEEIELRWNNGGAANTTSCWGDAWFSTGAGSPISGGTDIVAEPLLGSLASVNRTYTLTCENGSGGPQLFDTVTLTVNATGPTADPTLTANPTRVRQGDSTRLTGTLNSHQNCVLSGPNVDFGNVDGNGNPNDRVLNPTATSFNVTTGHVVGQSVYQLSCGTFAGTSPTATVRIQPTFEEI